MRQARTLEVETPDLARLEEGVYQGEWSIPPVTAGGGGTMEDGRIAAVQLVRHDHGLGGGAESLPRAGGGSGLPRPRPPGGLAGASGARLRRGGRSPALSHPWGWKMA